MSLPLVLDTDALLVFARDGWSSAPGELIAELTDDARTGVEVLIAADTMDAVVQQLPAGVLPEQMARVRELVNRPGVSVVRLMPEPQQFAELLRGFGIPAGSAAAYVLTVEVRGVLATYEPAAAMQELPPKQINDLGQSGDNPAPWPA